MPKSIGKAKLETADPPAIPIGKSAKNVVTDVNTVLVNVDEILSFIS